ncbi:MAG: hypothetical protein ACOYL6_03935 [Bacteriovoracaceae bacterium]
MDKDQSFINFLIEETMSISQGKPKEAIADVISLQAYFEKSRTKANPENAITLYTVNHNQEIIKQLVDSNSLTTFKGVYLKDLCCFRFKLKTDIIDIPQNWSCFIRLKERVLKKEECIIFVHPNNDIHSFLKVFGGDETWTGMILLWMDNDLRIVGFKAQESEFFDEVCSLFEPVYEIRKSA